MHYVSRLTESSFFFIFRKELQKILVKLVKVGKELEKDLERSEMREQEVEATLPLHHYPSYINDILSGLGSLLSQR